MFYLRTEKLTLILSDTTTSTLSSIFLELGRHPEHIAKLREELAPYMTDPSGEVLNEKITHLEHLNGIIDETLRLHPPVPTALQRKTPPEGIEIDGTYIPGDMTVWCPQYVLGRSKFWITPLPFSQTVDSFLTSRRGSLPARPGVYSRALVFVSKYGKGEIRVCPFLYG